MFSIYLNKWNEWQWKSSLAPAEDSLLLYKVRGCHLILTTSTRWRHIVSPAAATLRRSLSLLTLSDPSLSSLSPLSLLPLLSFPLPPPFPSPPPTFSPQTWHRLISAKLGCHLNGFLYSVWPPCQAKIHSSIGGEIYYNQYILWIIL